MERHEGRRRKHLGIVAGVAAGEADPQLASNAGEESVPQVERTGRGITSHGKGGIGGRGIDHAAIAVGEHRIRDSPSGKPIFVEAKHEGVWTSGVASCRKTADMQAPWAWAGTEDDEFGGKLLQPVEHVVGRGGGRCSAPMQHGIEFVEEFASGVAIKLAVASRQEVDESPGAHEHILGRWVRSSLALTERRGEGGEAGEPLGDSSLAISELLIRKEVCRHGAIVVITATGERLRRQARGSRCGGAEHRGGAFEAAADHHPSKLADERRRLGRIAHEFAEVEYAVSKHAFEAQLGMAFATPCQPVGEGSTRLGIGQGQTFGKCHRKVSGAVDRRRGRRKGCDDLADE